MSQDNVEIVRGGFEAWEANDLAGVLALFDDDLVTRRLEPMPDPGTWHGPDGMLDMLSEWMETFDAFTMKGAEFIDAGDNVVVQVAQEGRGDVSGVPVTGSFWFTFGVRDRKVVTLDMYAMREQALEAVGLSEQDAHADA